MIYEQDIKMLSLFYTAKSEQLQKEEKKAIIEFIVTNPVEESMNLLMTGNVDTLTPLERKTISRKFSESKEVKFIAFLNEEVERVSESLILEGWMPNDLEVRAWELGIKYAMSGVGQVHGRIAGTVAAAISVLKGDVWKVGGTYIPKPHKLKAMADTMAASYIGVGAVGVGAIVAGVSYLGYKIYERYLSKYAKICSSASGKAKTVCMAAAKSNAVEAQIKAMESKKSMCGKSKEKQKCISSLDKKINKLKSKYSIMQTQLRKVKSTMDQVVSQAKASKSKKV